MKQPNDTLSGATRVEVTAPVDVELVRLCERLFAIKAHAAAIGLHTEDRELLDCPSCGLQEDVTIDGCLITHDKAAVAADSGLRFNASENGRFVCPRCHTVVGMIEAGD